MRRSRHLQQLVIGTLDRDFAHHAPGLARLNHGSFGSPPIPVQHFQQEMRASWLAAPDEVFFSGRLQAGVADAAAAAAPLILAGSDEVCLVENATVATQTIFNRWMWSFVEGRAKQGEAVLILSVIYGACEFTLRATCGRAGAEIAIVDVPFPNISRDGILEAMERTLKTHRVRFAFLDHISSQPAVEFPIRDMVRLCHKHGVQEVCVDGSHTIGSAQYDVSQVGAEWFFSNLHKWAFAPNTATLLYGMDNLMKNTSHAVVSWNYLQGLKQESLFPGTRDFSAFLSVPAAIEYLNSWRSENGENSEDFCRRRVRESAQMLSDAWGTKLTIPDDMIATQAMVQLPPQLRVKDVPGVPGAGVRAMLREKFQVEAAIGNFGERGNFVRLSYAV